MKVHCFVDVIATVISKKSILDAGDSFEYGFAQSPMGKCFVATCRHGVCSLSFVDEDELSEISIFKKSWSGCAATRCDAMAQRIVNRFFGQERGNPIVVCLHGTDFQNQVWQALLRVAVGKTVAYSEVARMVGKPSAVRAAASAIASNAVGLLIPCHRVIRSNGALGQFGWGTARKAALLEWERCHSSSFLH